MISEKTYGEVVSEILMSMQNWSGSFMLVEGASDSKFWSMWKSSECEVVICTGRFSTIRALAEIERLDLRNVVGIVDDDQDRVAGRSISCRLLAVTDFSDLEVCQFLTGAWNRIQIEYGDRAKIVCLERDYGFKLGEILLAKAAELAKVRFVHRERESEISLKGFAVRRFVNKRLEIDWPGITTYLIGIGVVRSEEDFLKATSDIPPHRHEDLAQGHDLIDLVSLAFEDAVGNVTTGRARIAEMLRAGVQRDEVQAWHAYRHIKKLETSKCSFLAI